jgi:hypothetical protein
MVVAIAASFEGVSVSFYSCTRAPSGPIPDPGNLVTEHAAQGADAAPFGGETDQNIPSDGWWSLRYQGWVLLTPGGVRIHLSEIQRACFICLLDSPVRELLRRDLKNIKGNVNLRTLNVAICRLRKKVQQSGERLPLHTVHGMGYVFLGNLRNQS